MRLKREASFHVISKEFCKTVARRFRKAANRADCGPRADPHWPHRTVGAAVYSHCDETGRCLYVGECSSSLAARAKLQTARWDGLPTWNRTRKVMWIGGLSKAGAQWLEHILIVHHDPPGNRERGGRQAPRPGAVDSVGWKALDRELGRFEW